MGNKGPKTARGYIRTLETGKGTRKAPFERAVEQEVEGIDKSQDKKKKKITSRIWLMLVCNF